MKTVTLIATDGELLTISKDHLLVLSGFNWRPHRKSGYYMCSNGGTWRGYQIHSKYLHWFVMQLAGVKVPKGMLIDHINRNKRDNTVWNLRVASRLLQNYNQSMRKDNSSGCIGVAFNKNYSARAKPWVAYINTNGKRKHLGYYATPEEASEVYQAAKLLRDKQEELLCLK